MIADGKAVGSVGGEAGKSHPSPENLSGKKGTANHPKKWASDAFGGPDGLDVKYATVAGCVNLDHLERACPMGFEPFAGEVRDRIGPLLPRART